MTIARLTMIAALSLTLCSGCVEEGSEPLNETPRLTEQTLSLLFGEPQFIEPQAPSPWACLDCAQPATDHCAEQGWYGDGFCDEDCAQPDPDCAPPSDDSGPESDHCAEQGWYGDGVCDEGCAQPDPDCSGDSGSGSSDSGDYCAEQGWYGDGICDAGCAQPDPDC
ncbi:MAG: hypothetical protein CMH57_00805 [Myxococcales bacterium]|nr:hypothetical protein [Myxococcales bacterium]